MALADANCYFIVVDIGAAGRRSDGGIFQSSELKRQLEEKRLNIPKARLLSDKGPNVPYVIIGDEAFALTSYLLHAYPRKTNLTLDKKVFNYRLSRARRTVECAFGLLSSRWRIFRRPIATSVDNAISIIKATVCLHNFLMTTDLALPIQNRTYSVNIRPRNINKVFQNSRTFLIENDIRGSTVRDRFKEYFSTIGAIEQQWEKAQKNNFKKF
ncbi:uncharacterized protein LOC105207135 [Solenopsis invicta]|uniref:uncharacterized protein LOC105207135 n=1 Tax=Solenopsis invicta TaxID=13686 RepID=UPI00193E8AC8|nr:uncharacterized protein LOC105207135 [Solenopsis invicta]